MWFSRDDIYTEALNALVEYNLPKVVKEIREKVRQFFIDFENVELRITAKQIEVQMLDRRWDKNYIVTECNTHFGIDFLKNETGERVLEYCTYQWKIYQEGTDDFDIRKDKHRGQVLVFRREDFLTEYEIKSLYPPRSEIPVLPKIEFPCHDTKEDDVCPY